MEVKKRSTKTKQMVMNVLEQSDSALSHEEISENLSEKIDRVTIYRILQSFYDDGKLHKIAGDNGKTYFSLCRNCSEGHHHDTHPHFRCTECNTVRCLDDEIPSYPTPVGYTVSNISTFLTGVCPKCSNMLVLFCTILFAFFISDSISAQNNGAIPDSTHILPEIMVSTGWSHLQGENVTNVEKITLKQANYQGVSLSDKLTNIAGLDNFSTGAGIGKPVIRGLSGNRIAVFSQGIRIENQQWGDEHGLGLDDNGYEQVEVIKGPASLLYGSDALGGVLYFADERFAAKNNVEAALNSEIHSNTLGLRNTGVFKMSKNRLHFNLFGGYTTHEDYTDGGGNFVPNSRFNTSDLKTTLGYTGEKFTTSLKYNFLNEKYGLTEAEEEIADYSNGRNPFSPYQHLVTHLISNNSSFYFNNDSKLQLDLGFISNGRKEFEELDNAALDMNLNTLSYAAKWYSPRWNDWEMIAGSQGLYQTNANSGEEVLIPDAATFDIGAFAMANFHYSGNGYW
ncbi:MAG: TonB-dependent receptor plug domain-containing protein, partial [Candidatus Symbiothrix sp.]|nr:TonB-dependent receptor plug domain-containing protein [Candidatus Symbiothrix sp.]